LIRTIAKTLAVYNLPEADIARAKLHQDCRASVIQINPGGAKVAVQFTTADRGARILPSPHSTNQWRLRSDTDRRGANKRSRLGHATFLKGGNRLSAEME
jgi:hypothetical protein